MCLFDVLLTFCPSLVLLESGSLLCSLVYTKATCFVLEHNFLADCMTVLDAAE